MRWSRAESLINTPTTFNIVASRSLTLDVASFVHANELNIEQEGLVDEFLRAARPSELDILSTCSFVLPEARALVV